LSAKILDMKKDADIQDHSHRSNAALHTENTDWKYVQSFGRNITKCEISGFSRGVAETFAVLGCTRSLLVACYRRFGTTVPETAAMSYKLIPPNITEEQRPDCYITRFHFTFESSISTTKLILRTNTFERLIKIWVSAVSVILSSRLEISLGYTWVATFNPLAQDFFFNLAHPVRKMRIIQNQKKVALWNKRHFEAKKTECVQHV
jgi:hypothetical protein